jgi:hypothetical protein
MRFRGARAGVPAPGPGLAAAFRPVVRRLERLRPKSYGAGGPHSGPRRFSDRSSQAERSEQPATPADREPRNHESGSEASGGIIDRSCHTDADQGSSSSPTRRGDESSLSSRSAPFGPRRSRPSSVSADRRPPASSTSSATPASSGRRSRSSTGGPSSTASSHVSTDRSRPGWRGPASDARSR